MVIAMVIIAIGAFGLIPLVENIKFPKYKCKNCGYIFSYKVKKNSRKEGTVQE